MKASRTTSTKFQPFNLVITVENEAEAKALYAIFNHTANVNILPCANNDMVASEIKAAIGNQFYDQEIKYPNGRSFYTSRKD